MIFACGEGGLWLNRLSRSILLYLVIIFIAFSLISRFSTEMVTQEKIDYTQFLDYVNKGEIERVKIVEREITGITKSGLNFRTINPGDQNLIETLTAKNVAIDSDLPAQPTWWQGLISNIFPVLLLIGAWIFLMQQTQGGGNRVMQFGKSRAKLHTEDKTKVTFADVAGVDEAKEELQEVVEFLKHPKKFMELGARIPKGVLLFGPPGTGKTLLARAVAGEAGVPFFSISGSDFVEMFVGVGASRVRDLFDQAKKHSPCIVFIDEIDAVGRQRGAGLGGGHDEREQTLNQLLVEMDGFGVNEGIIVLAGTNRPDILDPALLRPGRFDRQIAVDRPDVLGRKEILKVHAKGKPLAKEVDLDVLARRTPGFTGADLANLMNEAALLAARRNKKQIGMSELEDAVDRVIAGPERKSRLISDKEKRLVAYHESGHTLVAWLIPNADPIHKVTIIPRGGAGGYTLMLPKEDRYFMTRGELMDKIAILLGGRVAEELVLNEISTGAQNDLERATALARKMVTEYGMSEAIGPLTLGNRQEQVFLGRDIARDRNYSEEVASTIDKEVRRLIETSYERAKKLINGNLEKLHLLAEELIKKETLEGEEVKLLLEGKVKQLEERKDDKQEINPIVRFNPE